jgi:hypothetical protein
VGFVVDKVALEQFSFRVPITIIIIIIHHFTIAPYYHDMRG